MLLVFLPVIYSYCLKLLISEFIFSYLSLVKYLVDFYLIDQNLYDKLLTFFYVFLIHWISYWFYSSIIKVFVLCLLNLFINFDIIIFWYLIITFVFVFEYINFFFLGIYKIFISHFHSECFIVPVYNDILKNKQFTYLQWYNLNDIILIFLILSHNLLQVHISKMYF